MPGLYLFLLFIAATVYVSLAIKIGFIVGDKTVGTGFDAGFYMITVLSLIALPFCIYIGLTN